MSKDVWTSWREQPVLEVILIWFAVLLAFAVAAWQLGPTLTGANLAHVEQQAIKSDIRIAGSD